MALEVIVNPNSADDNGKVSFEHDRLVSIDIKIKYSDGFERDVVLYFFGNDLGEKQGGCAKNMNVDTPEPYKPEP